MTTAAAPAPRAELTVAGSRTAYWAYGEEDAPHVLVALHGLRGTHHGLEPITARLARTRVLVPDLPGFGESTPWSGAAHDVTAYAAWARSFVGAVAPGATLLGHSFGSIVATAAATGMPIRGLVLINPIAVDDPHGPRRWARALTVHYHRLAAALPERAGTALLRHPGVTRAASTAMITTTDPALRAWIHAEHGRHFGCFADRRVLLEAFAAATGEDVGRYAAGVSVPTLLVAGEHDDIAPLAAQQRLVPGFADARLVVVSGTGHLAHYETPAAVAHAIATFLER